MLVLGGGLVVVLLVSLDQVCPMPVDFVVGLLVMLDSATVVGNVVRLLESVVDSAAVVLLEGDIVAVPSDSLDQPHPVAPVAVDSAAKTVALVVHWQLVHARQLIVHLAAVVPMSGHWVHALGRLVDAAVVVLMQR